MKRNRLLDFFFPPKCMFCGKLLMEGTTFLCEACSAPVPRPDPLPLPGTGSCRAPFRYEGTAKAAVRRYKFNGCRCYAGGMALHMSRLLRDNRPDLITWVPVSGLRRLERGYDQSELLAKELSALSGIPYSRLLNRRHTARQSTVKSKEARRSNVAGAFSLREPAELSGKRILLLDDICTTGSTLGEAAKVLRKAGAEVDCLAFALTEKY